MFSERDGGSIADVWLRPDKPQAVVGIVGSEGGWSDEEIHQAGTAGCRVVTLGGRILRAETAAIATMALVQYIYGDLG